MQSLSNSSVFLTATLTLVSACTIDQPAGSDGEGPTIEVTASGGAEFVIKDDTRRLGPADNCANVSDVAGAQIGDRSVDISVVTVDQSGMNRSQITVTGEGIRPNSVVVTPQPNPVFDVTDGRDVDEITLTYLRSADGVLNASIVQFTIDSPFTPGVTISATGVDAFGNPTTFDDFELLSDFAVCNY